VQKKILIVDDEKLVRWTIQQSMVEENFRFVSASTGTEAIEKMREEPFDIVITDFVMPGSNGIEVARSARQLHPDSKIIMITAHESMLDREEASSAGVSSIINKPFMVREVRKAIFDLLSENRDSA
jgi:CheY-like chemotaxis protein